MTHTMEIHAIRPMVLASRIGQEPASRKRLALILHAARLIKGVQALPAPEAALACVASTRHTVFPKAAKALIPPDWQRLAFGHAVKRRTKATSIAAKPIQQKDWFEATNTITFHRTTGRAGDWVEFPDFPVGISIQESTPSNQVASWLLVGAAAAALGFEITKSHRFIFVPFDGARAELPQRTARRLIELGQWLGLDPEAGAK